MNLFKTSTSIEFLDEIANFVLNKFNNNIDKVKIIVSSRYVATCLQKIITQKKQRTILPDIIPYHYITPESFIFDITTQDLSALSLLEEQIIFAEIIHSYEPLKYNLTQCLKFAPLLSKLFDEFNLNKIDIKNIKNLPTLNQAEHWKFIYDFLSYAHKHFFEKLDKIGKIAGSLYQIQSLDSKIEEDNIVIIAGFIGNDKATWSYLSKISKRSNGYIILPPLPEKPAKQDSKFYDNLYCLKSLFLTMDKKFDDFEYLGVAAKTSKFDRILCNDFEFKDKEMHDINYIETSDIFKEAESIALICQKYYDKKIAIILCNDSSNEYYEIFLKKYNIRFQSLIGTSLIKTIPCELILSLTDLLYSDFNLKKLFILIKNPLLPNSFLYKLENILSGSNRFVQNYEDISKILEEGDSELIQWWKGLLEIIKDIPKFYGKFTYILTEIIKIIEKLVPHIWSKEIIGSEDLANSLREILETESDIYIEDCSEFYDILKILLSSTKKFNDIEDQNILISYPHEAIYSKFDVVIFADFNSGSWPPDEAINPWLNKEMQQELEFYPEQIKSNSYLYNFYLLLHNPKIFITRSITKDNDEVMPSNYLNKLKYYCGNIIKNAEEFKNAETYDKKIGCNVSSYESHSNDYYNSSSIFPHKISATEIELLVRSPYSFYVKKILGLKKIDFIDTKPKLSEFGNFIHSVIDEYLKKYECKIDCHLNVSCILNIGEGIINNILLPFETKKSWNIKLAAIAPQFIKFDEERKKQCVNIYSEIRGEFMINILGHNIEISARADRIEVDTKGRVSILDYKTGGIPTKKEVFSGLSPQLIIIALIILERGFKEIESTEIKELIYIKIGSSDPYIQTLEIKITQDELASHKSGLIKLLEFYITGGQFSKETNFLKYNDFKHFIRKF